MSPGVSASSGVKIAVRDLDLFYGQFQALKGVTVELEDRAITSVIGPSGCGKTTFLRALNRMNDLVEGATTRGEVLLDGLSIYAPGTDLTSLRRRVGMVFQRPNAFPLSVFENVAYGPRVHRMASGAELNAIVERSLVATGLWDELKDNLKRPALELSAEQQQRLCISRLVAVEPEVLLMDEPCSTLDPTATGRVEELMQDLKSNYCIVIVTHNMQQAARVSDKVGFMLLGELVEFGPIHQIFTVPRDKRTEDYVTGRYG
jgi:phosphate transport system ATP-binding protein